MRKWPRTGWVVLLVAWVAGLLALAFSLLAPASTREQAAVEAAGRGVIWQRYSGVEGRFTFLFPSGWSHATRSGGVVIRPMRGAEGSPVAALEVRTGDEPLTEWLQGAEVVHQADNVAVGGVSGRETVYLLPEAGQGAPASQLAPGRAPEMTLIVWQGPSAEPRLRVVMFDGAAGAYLPLLEAVRESIQWLEP